MNLSELDRQIKKCRKCRLWRTAESAVPGEGPQDARIMLVGQGPGKEEDRTGKPFAGMAGEFLGKVLEKNSIKRGSLFITSILKHRTPKNRKPKKDEINACLPFLEKQIGIVSPKLIVLMGNIAKRHAPRKKGIKYIETCHPAAAMRFPEMKRIFMRDFKKLKKRQKA